MLKNYVLVALRTLRKQPGYSFINVGGLGLGLAAALLIGLYVHDELSYERHFPDADRIYQVGLDARMGAQDVEIGTSAIPMGPTLVADVPEVETATRVLGPQRQLMEHRDSSPSGGRGPLFENGLIWADSTFFEVFPHPALAGDPTVALARPNSLVLTRAAADRHFDTQAGFDGVVGQSLRLDRQTDYTVRAVIEDFPSSSILQAEVIASFVTILDDLQPIWLSHYTHTYIRLREDADVANVEAAFPRIIEQYVAPEVELFLGTTLDDAQGAGTEWSYFLQPLPDLYLQPRGNDQVGPTGDVRYVYALTVVALFILLLAGINFTNLSTARSANRAREVGLRKVLGSDRRRLIAQFLGESVLLALAAAGVAALLVVLLLPLFESLSGKTLAFSTASALGLGGALLAIALVCGVLAGLYPAFVLSAFEPVTVMKGQLSRGAKSGRLRSTLVVTQFAVSVTLLIGTAVVYQQLQHMQTSRLGFEGDQVVTVPVISDEARGDTETFLHTLVAHPGIEDAAAADFLPGRTANTTSFRPVDAPPEDVYVLAAGRVSHDYLQTLGVSLVAGRTFDPAQATDSTGAMLLNEAAVREFGWTVEEAPGRQVGQIELDGLIVRTVVGVMEDFHFESLHRQIRPLTLTLDPGDARFVAVQVRADDLPATLAHLETAWTAFEPGYPYDSVFLDADFQRFYAQERQLGQVFFAFTLLAVFVACLGLFGLASFLAQQRTKEIGVRKVLGASVPSLVRLLAGEFTRLVVIAALVAMPVAYLLMRQWLQSFAYATPMPWWAFVGAGFAALLVAALTVSYQSIRTATTDPVKALRYE
ncbi:MAG: ABC transporter permease [Bacteroidota bacterium]